LKHNTHGHVKMRRLARLLGIPRMHAVGIMQVLWDTAADCYIAGDIGRLSDDEIADIVDWPDDPKRLVNALVEAKWLDRDNAHRLIIHDWDDHAEGWVKKRAASRGVTLLHRGDGDIKTPAANGGVAVSQSLTPTPTASDSHSDDGSVAGDGMGRDGIGSGEAFGRAGAREVRLTWPEVAGLFADYPRLRRGTKGMALRLFERAVGDIAASGRADPIGYLHGRIKAYASSWVGSREDGQYAVGLDRFVDERVYESDDGDWAAPKPNGHANGIDVGALVSKAFGKGTKT